MTGFQNFIKTRFSAARLAVFRENMRKMAKISRIVHRIDPIHATGVNENAIEITSDSRMIARLSGLAP